MSNTFVMVPSKVDVEKLKVGDAALDAFGRYSRVVEVFARGIDVHGKAYVCFKTDFGPGATMTASMKEDELVRHAGLRQSSAELDRIEREMVANGETVRVIVA